MVPNEERMQRFTQLLPLERMYGAWSNDVIVGGAGSFAFDLTVPGGDVPCAGVSVVGVLPTHRRRGVLRSLMRAQIDDAHERGEPLAALWASEESIYGRFGYGLASFCGEITLAREHTAFALPFEPEGTLRLIEPEEAEEAIPPVYEGVRPDWPGMFTLLPPDHPLFLLLATPRRMRYRMGDGIWVRLVDVGAALSGRSYATDGSIVFDVVDEFCPWNEGRWKLEGGRAERSKDEPDVSLPVQSLGSALLGGVSFARLRRAGRLVELKQGAIERADALFPWDRLPWCPEIF